MTADGIPITRDTYMAREFLSEVNLAAQLGTDNQRFFPEDNPAKPAPYRDIGYGSGIALIMASPAPDTSLALQSEIERIMAFVGSPGTAVVSDRVGVATTLDATLTIDPQTGVLLNG